MTAPPAKNSPKMCLQVPLGLIITRQKSPVQFPFINSTMIEQLPEELLKETLAFVGPYTYLTVALVSQRFRKVYLQSTTSDGRDTAFSRKTSIKLMATKPTLIEFCMDDHKHCSDQEKRVLAEKLACCAGIIGQMDTLHYLYDTLGFVPLKYSALEKTIVAGHFEVVQFVYTNGLEQYRDTSLLFFCACHAAANGRIDILQWINNKEKLTSYTYIDFNHTNSLPRPYYMDASGGSSIDEISATGERCLWLSASLSKKVEVFEWLSSNGFGTQPPLEIVYEFISSDRMDLMQWIQVRTQNVSDERLCACAAYYGNVNILKWLRYVGCAWDAFTVMKSYQRGNHDCLQWAIENGCPYPDIHIFMEYDNVFCQYIMNLLSVTDRRVTDATVQEYLNNKMLHM